MKLYATTRNTKGKAVKLGSNEGITFEIDKGNRRMFELFLTIEDLDGKEFMACDILNLSDGITQRVFDYEFYPKGERQKGECDHACTTMRINTETCDKCGKVIE